jgi:hypothetical protein
VRAPRHRNVQRASHAASAPIQDDPVLASVSISLESGKIPVEHVKVEKPECAEGLVLSRGAHLSRGGESCEKLPYFRRSDLVRMTLVGKVVKEHIALDPADEAY